MRICVVTPRFIVSGVSLAQVRFARALASEGHEVDLVVGRVDPHLTLPDAPGVRLIVLDRPNVKSMLLPLWKYLRIDKPDVVFSAEDHMNAIVLLAAILARSKAKISGSCRVTPFDTYSNVPFTKRWLLKHVIRAVTWRADALTCVSKDMVDQYRQVFRSAPHVCVYNIVDDVWSRKRIEERVEDEWLVRKDLPVLVAAGTLAPWKGFDDLIRAVAELWRNRRKVRLMILGEGPMRPELQSLINELGMADCIRLVGSVENPLKYFARADVFVLSSKVEGLPNVMVEAMMCGCTPVATDCPTGPREILEGGRFGYLVPVGDTRALAAGIEQALDRPVSQELLAEAVRPFEMKTVLEQHFNMLDVESVPASAQQT